ncbi:MAG TPA: nitroreductase family deazaflavin-dependent oxidoreductase [Pseudonocardiaceae bacterium]|jgi:deazaflavin-dependent oxidoreductase (nitroreductase family)|nr:nitroreductase family deazaflavin-dependent oxidoreductase [Pseudonocardiaceae bacterium]
MVAPRGLAKFNRHVTNPVLGTVAPRLPGFGVIVHTGRKSGRTYRTPVNIFRTADGYLVALTYGKDTDWVRNVLAAGGCDAVIRGHQVHLTSPELVHDPRRTAMPTPVRQFLGVLGVTDFLALRA